MTRLLHSRCLAGALAGSLLLALGKLNAGDSPILWVLAALCVPVFLALGNIYRARYWPAGASPLSLAPGMLLGGRGWRAHQPHFPARATLDIRMTLLMRDDRMGSFEGDIRHGSQLLASGRLNTYQPNEAELQQVMSQGNQP